MARLISRGRTYFAYRPIVPFVPQQHSQRADDAVALAKAVAHRKPSQIRVGYSLYAARSPRLKLAVHDVGINVPMNRVQESVWNPPNNIEVETLPKAHGPIIGAHDEIELHCPESAVSSMVKRMRTHRSSETFARRVGCGYVSAV